MAHGAIRTTRHGIKRPAKHGGALTLATTGSMASVTLDAGANKYVPSSAAEWTTTLSVAGIASGGPSNLYLCQEASGSLADSIGAAPLAQAGAGHLYAQSIAPWTRLGVRTIDGTVGQRWLNSTTSPNPNLVSTLWLAYIAFPAVAPAAARDLIANQASLDCRVTAAGKFNILNGASTSGTANPLAASHPIVIKHDITNSLFTGYTEQEKVVGTFAVNVSNPMLALGGQTTSAADAGYVYVVEFSGAAAEMTDAQIKTLLQTLNWTVLW
jgi:hypothetical protein